MVISASSGGSGNTTISLTKCTNGLNSLAVWLKVPLMLT